MNKYVFRQNILVLENKSNKKGFSILKTKFIKSCLICLTLYILCIPMQVFSFMILSTQDGLNPTWEGGGAYLAPP